MIVEQREFYKPVNIEEEIENLRKTFPEIFLRIPDEYFIVLKKYKISLLKLDNFEEPFRLWSPDEIHDEFLGIFEIESQLEADFDPQNLDFKWRKLVIADDEGGGFRYCYKLTNPSSGLYYCAAGSFPDESDRIADNLLDFLGINT